MPLQMSKNPLGDQQDQARHISNYTTKWIISFIGPSIIVVGIGCMQLNLSYIFVGNMVIELTEPRGWYERKSRNKKKKKKGEDELDPSIFVWSASSSLILLKFKSQREKWHFNHLWIEEWEDYHFQIIRKCLSRVTDFVLTTGINEASSDVIISRRNHRYRKIIDKLN